MMGNEYNPTEESFLNDVSKHSMEILLDNGVYRHLRFTNNGSNVMRFDIVTYPGHLVYSGDMGSFVFSRLNDMFEFFRTGNRVDGKLSINPGYWSEKLEAVDRCDSTQGNGFKEYSSDKFKNKVNEHVDEWIKEYAEEFNSDFEDSLRLAVKDDVLIYADDGEYKAHESVRDFDYEYEGQRFEFYDTWEWDFGEYTYRFIWCLYAILWAINEYDLLPEKNQED
jgi:hypothetical protein